MAGWKRQEAGRDDTAYRRYWWYIGALGAISMVMMTRFAIRLFWPVPILPQWMMLLPSYCAKHKLEIDMLCLAVAGPGNWPAGRYHHQSLRQFDAGKVAAAMNVRAYLLINDFTAQAMAHRDLLQQDRSLPTNHRQILRGGTPDHSTPLLVIGPGTGLGVAALVPAGDAVQVIEGEGGHVSYAPRNPAEEIILAHLAKKLGHVSAERIVSGPALNRSITAKRVIIDRRRILAHWRLLAMRPA